MTQGQEDMLTRRCPRCGGLMKKPANSSFFWHAENNHPRCDITNIVDTAPLVVQMKDVPDAIADVAEFPFHLLRLNLPGERHAKIRLNKGARMHDATCVLRPSYILLIRVFAHIGKKCILN